MLSDLFDFSIGTVSVSVVSALLAVWGWSKIFAEKRLDLEFNKRLEKHKNDLELITNRIQFEYSLKTHDYNNYSEKKHQVYAELFSRFSIAMQSMWNLMKESPETNYYKLGKVRVELLLRHQLNTPEEIIKDTLNKWDNSEGFVNDLNKFFWSLIVTRAIKSLDKAREYHLHNALYLDQEIEEYCIRLISSMDEWRRTYLEHIEMHHESGIRQQIRSEYTASHEKAELFFSELSDKMRSELKYGKYNDLETAKATQ